MVGTNITGANNIGGVAGYVNGGAVQNCYVTGSVSGANNIGGVAGYVNGGTVQNCAALNPSVGGSISCGRVAGANDGGALSGSYAFDGMTGGGSDKTANGKDGADMSAGQAVTAAFWTTAANWNTSSWNGTVWTFENGRLPLLKNLVGQSDVLPPYLLRFSATPLTAALSGTGVSGSGTSYSAPFSAFDRPITVTVTGWEDWTNPEVTVTAKKPNNDAIAVTPQDTSNGGASFVLPGSLSGDFTITAAAKTNPDNVKTILTLTVGTVPIITASAGAGGSISPSGPVTVSTGSQTFTIVPGDGHIIASVTVDGVNRGALSSYTFADVTGDHTINAAFTTERFSLTPGGTYYFDLSGQGIPGTVNANLPDTSLKWLPFTYVGTVNAYSRLSEGVSTDGTVSVGDRSLFVADYNAVHTVSWDDLDAESLIFGKSYSSGGVFYRLRSLSIGSRNNNEWGIPESNEWDQILNKASDYIKNSANFGSWGQDTSTSAPSVQAIRESGRDYYDNSSSVSDADIGFRPVLEVLNPDALDSSGGLKTVTFQMGGNGSLGGGSLASATVVYTGTLVLPEIIPANGFTYTGSGTGTLGWWSGGTFYAPGATPGLAAGVTLTAGYESSSTPLATPTGLAWDGTTPGKATWNSVSSASSYSVQLYKGGAVQGDPINSGTATEYNFASIIATAGSGSYTFSVTAIGNGSTYTDSVESAASAAYLPALYRMGVQERRHSGDRQR